MLPFFDRPGAVACGGAVLGALPLPELLCSALLDFDFRGSVGKNENDPPAPWPELIDRDRDGPVTTSVLVTTLNHGAFIEDCIDSLLVQTVLPGEIIVCDAGSEDDTVSRLRAYGPRIVLIADRPADGPPHVRQANAWQAALARASGRLVFLLNGDDRFKRTKIDRYAAAFAANPDASLVQAPMDHIDEFGRMVGSNFDPKKHVADCLKEIYRRQDLDLFYPTSALAFARSYLDSVFPLEASEGVILRLATRLSIIAPHFGRVITLPHALTDCRRHSGGPFRPAARPAQVRQMLRRTQLFNAFSRRHGLRTISAWRNYRFYLQLLRCSMPETTYRLLRQRLRRAAAPLRGLS